jgi:beta-lactamase regulating signal transducer with metallopeptidase domain
MSSEMLSLAAGWAWRTSLEALPLAIVAIVLWRARILPTSWRWCLPALFFLRLAMPAVPQVEWRPKLEVAPVPWQQSNAERGTRNNPTRNNPTRNAEREKRNWEDVVASATPILADQSGTEWLRVLWERVSEVLPLVWGAGVCAIAGWVVISQWKLRGLIRRQGRPVHDLLKHHCDWAAARMGFPHGVKTRVLPGWPTMAVSGWLRPVLLLPDDLLERHSPSQVRGMLLHELAHIRRCDVLWTWLALGLCALHWFNPLAWLALRRFHGDRELACDAAALRGLAPAARRDYGEALLLCLQSPAIHPAPALAPFYRRLPELKHRLQSIMNPTNPTLLSRLCAVLLIPSLAAITFTTARAQQREGAAPISAEQPDRESDQPRRRAREGDAVRDGDGARKEGLRDGDAKKSGARDGDQPRTGPRDGEGARKEGARDGEAARKEGARDGDGARKEVARDGDGARKEGARDGDQPRREGARDGDGARKEGARDGDQPRREGARDGDGARKEGARDGDQPRREGARDGDGARKEGARDGEGARKEGARE